MQYPANTTPFTEELAANLTPVAVGNTTYERIRDELLRRLGNDFDLLRPDIVARLRPLTGMSIDDLQRQCILACLRDMWRLKLIDIAVRVNLPFSSSEIYIRKL